MRGRAGRGGGIAVVLAMSTLMGCEGPTDPPIAAGSVTLAMAPMTSSGPPESWMAEGSCGEEGFVLGARTCAYGTDETAYWLALGVVAYEDDTYDTVGAVHPPAAGTCEASSAMNSRCTVEIRRGWPGEEAPPATYLLDTGTVTADTATVGGILRLTGTFEGMAIHVDAEGDPLAPLLITDGVFDVELTP